MSRADRSLALALVLVACLLGSCCVEPQQLPPPPEPYYLDDPKDRPPRCECGAR